MTEAFRVLVTGSRDWADEALLCAQLAKAVAEREPGQRAVIVHGDCPTGADKMADWWAGTNWTAVERHPAWWRVNGKLDKSAGFRRNAEMVTLGADLCLAFIKDGSRGASHCADAAEKAGIPVRRFTA